MAQAENTVAAELETAELETEELEAEEAGIADVDLEIEPFIRIDRDDTEAYERELDNLRLITEGTYDLQKPKEKYGIDPLFSPDLTGLDTLNVSASAQFNAWQFARLADTIRELADGKEVYVFDLRRESHMLLDGHPFSWYKRHNWSNEGLSLEEIEQDETERFGAVLGKTFQAFVKEDDNRGGMIEFTAHSMMSEKELVESEGFHYIRIPVVDHTWPTAEQVDEFIDFVKSHNHDDVWLHFHCHAGSGRTGAFLVIYDKMMNPEIPILDICVRQTMLGASYMLQENPADPYKIPLYLEKIKRVRQFGDYVEENAPDYEVSWSEWLKKN